MLDTTTGRPAVIEGEWPVPAAPARRRFLEVCRERSPAPAHGGGPGAGRRRCRMGRQPRVYCRPGPGLLRFFGNINFEHDPAAVGPRCRRDPNSGREFAGRERARNVEIGKSARPRNRPGRIWKRSSAYRQDRDHASLPGTPPMGEPDSSDASRKQALIALLRANIAVRRIGSSQIVAVRARALTAMDAARLTNEIAEAFVQEQYDANAVVSTSAALRERIKVLGPTARIISEAVPPKSKDRADSWNRHAARHHSGWRPGSGRRPFVNRVGSALALCRSASRRDLGRMFRIRAPDRAAIFGNGDYSRALAE